MTHPSAERRVALVTGAAREIRQVLADVLAVWRAGRSGIVTNLQP